jgi:hypothetical protein
MYLSDHRASHICVVDEVGGTKGVRQREEEGRTRGEN